MGIAATSVELRTMAARGNLNYAPTQFELSDNVCQAGVLFLVPALCSQGLLRGMEVYDPLKPGYYGLLQILLLLCIMYLSRIKNPEQLKQCKPGELGKLMGLDRVPEVKCLRGKISEIVDQHKAEAFNRMLFREWLDEQQPGSFFFYIDGHVKVYSGHKATLPKKHVSRQKLCLAGTTEYWVNNEQGLPYLVVTEELNYKLKAAIIDLILPILLKEAASLVDQDLLEKDPEMPRFTIVFDREAYEPAFFGMLWKEHRVAVITYRKNVQDKWEESLFEETDVKVINNDVEMRIYEKPLEISGVKMREIRKLGKTGHQTAILTTNPKITKKEVAGKMFSRWSQENFFKYGIANYDLDKLIQYGTEEIDLKKWVVNPAYSRLTNELKKLREKKARVQARLFDIVEKNIDQDIEAVRDSLAEAGDLQENRADLDQRIEQKISRRKQQPSRIRLGEMPKNKRYNKLKSESKLFINTIKMIAYRAESAMVSTITPFYKRANQEARMLIKEIIKSDADLKPDYQNKTLTVTLHSLSTPRANKAAAELAQIINETETIYPGTELKLFFKTV